MELSSASRIEQKQRALTGAEADYRAGVVSVSAVARKHGMAESTLRREAMRLGWTRASQDKRQHLVAEAMAGTRMASEMTDEQVRQIQREAADQDIHDMSTGLAVARKVLTRLLGLVDMLDDPRDLKVVVDANKAAIETIRQIRSLDAADTAVQTSVSIDVSDGFAELHAAFSKHLNRSTPI